ncbi:hypothetical protein HXZ62_04940 [Empedobacter falsenii]|uniref:XRE family transcriptional regulator n=3 Tax=Empedobacter TaxID=59734 RepID=A0AAW7DHK4_9FLAO|nr:MULTISPECIES: hypothetical protein [Empedobacter]MDM1061914.1 hypothetical protein [Empedobacter falsenii]MDM1551524.1 hypothetical protein [Empedobacter falsenii]
MIYEQLKPKIMTGDYITLARMLGLNSPDSARMRCRRGDIEALEALEKIIENRDQLIKNYQNDDSEQNTTNSNQ